MHALNDAERTCVVEFAPAAADRTFVIPNGIAVPDVPPALEEKSGALYLGRLHPKKQVLELVNAWQAGHFGCRLTIAGWGDRGYVQRVERAVAQSSNVEFVGPAYGELKSRLLVAARFLLLPSLSEGLPMAVLEGLSQGCIPVITRECNLPELLESGVALPIESDFSDFSSAIRCILATGEQRLHSLSRAALSASAKYSWEHIAAEMLQRYMEIAPKAPTGW